MKKCKSEQCLTQISENAPDYCPEHNELIMTLNTAIKRAIESGFNPKVYGDFNNQETQSHILLDPQFWQCLGVAMGWGDEHKEWWCPEHGKSKDYWSHHDNWHCEQCGKKLELKEYKAGGADWLYQWHLFIDALASGKTADEAMGEIIK